MPLFVCSKCRAVDNTALGAYWHRTKEPLCSECDPDNGEWHGEFPKESVDNGQWVMGTDGHIYKPSELGPKGYFRHVAKPKYCSAKRPDGRYRCEGVPGHPGNHHAEDKATHYWES